MQVTDKEEWPPRAYFYFSTNCLLTIDTIP